MQFKVGQKWKFSGQPHDPEPNLTIVKIDLNKKIGDIIHISVSGVKFKNPNAPKGFGSEIVHLPFNEEALKESVTEMISENNSLPDFQEGYNAWREAFDQSQAGVFTVSVSEAVEFVETTLNQ